MYSTKKNILIELNQYQNYKGYFEVHLWKNGKRKKHKVHRLVAEKFVPNPDEKPQINHIDGNKENNHFSNLQWVTGSENVQHAWDMGLCIGNSQSNFKVEVMKD